jgi:hypothetical protein
MASTHDLVGQIYGAALGPAPWERVASRIARLLNGVSVGFSI